MTTKKQDLVAGGLYLFMGNYIKSFWPIVPGTQKIDNRRAILDRRSWIDLRNGDILLALYPLDWSEETVLNLEDDLCAQRHGYAFLTPDGKIAWFKEQDIIDLKPWKKLCQA